MNSELYAKLKQVRQAGLPNALAIGQSSMLACTAPRSLSASVVVFLRYVLGNTEYIPESSSTPLLTHLRITTLFALSCLAVPPISLFGRAKSRLAPERTRPICTQIHRLRLVPPCVVLLPYTCNLQATSALRSHHRPPSLVTTTIIWPLNRLSL